MVLSCTQAPLSTMYHGVLRHDRCLRDSEASFAPQTTRKVAIIFHLGESWRKPLVRVPEQKAFQWEKRMWSARRYSQAGFQACWKSWVAFCLSCFLYLHGCLLSFIVPMCSFIFSSSWKMVLSTLADSLTKWSV